MISHITRQPRRPRGTSGGVVFHVVNRATEKREPFSKTEDYDAFERIIASRWERISIRLLAYCLMPNHWHFLPWPRRDNELSEFVRPLRIFPADTTCVIAMVAAPTPGAADRYREFLNSF